jgi:hypothetical protein
MKYVKKIWSHKLNKLGNDNRHLIWEYYKDRNKNHVAGTILKAHYLNINNFTIIYFSDPVQYDIVLTSEIIEQLKEHAKGFNEFIKAHKKPRKPRPEKIEKPKKTTKKQQNKKNNKIEYNKK